MKELPEKSNRFLLEKEREQTENQAFSGTAENYDLIHETGLACFSLPGFYQMVNTALGKNPIVGKTGKPSKGLYLKLYCNKS